MRGSIQPPRARAAVVFVAFGLSLFSLEIAAAQGTAPRDTAAAAQADTAFWRPQPRPATGERWNVAKCISTALESNVDARTARAQTEQARGSALGAWSGILPSISGNLAATGVIPDKQSSFRGLAINPSAFGDSIPRQTYATRNEYLSAGASLDMNIITPPAWKEKNRQDHLKRSFEEG